MRKASEEPGAAPSAGAGPPPASVAIIAPALDEDEASIAARAARRREPLRPAHVNWLRPGLRTAAVAVAATTGVLVRYGIASGMGALGVFIQSGRLLAGVTRTDGALAHVGAALVGLMVHALVVTAWTLVYARVVVGWRATWRWLTAFVVAGLAWAADTWLLPSMLHVGYGARASMPQLVLLHVVLALGLVVGMRLALAKGDEQ